MEPIGPSGVVKLGPRDTANGRTRNERGNVIESGMIEAEIPHLRRYARALLRDREAADDLVQDALERAWRKRHLWRPMGVCAAGCFASSIGFIWTVIQRRRAIATN